VFVISRNESYVNVSVHWDGDEEGLRRLFTHEPVEHWEIGREGQVQMPAGIGPWEADGPDIEDAEGRYWRDSWILEVKFERPAFGGPDTIHWGSGKWKTQQMPFF
jgi:hypothetical protein